MYPAKFSFLKSLAARVLRLLATHHIFNEMAAETFSNNRISSMMDTLKSVDEIKARSVHPSPEDR